MYGRAPRFGFGARRGPFFAFFSFFLGGFLMFCLSILGILGIAALIYATR